MLRMLMNGLGLGLPQTPSWILKELAVCMIGPQEDPKSISTEDLFS